MTRAVRPPPRSMIDATPAPTATDREPPLEVSDQLTAVAPELLAAEEYEQRKQLVRQRLFGAGAPWRLGRFTVRGVLGAGATSVVYEAWDEMLRRRVAIKVLRAALPAEADARLHREAMALARLAHPNVVAIYEIGSWEGRPFLAMERIEGQTLRAWLDARPRPWQDVLDVMLQVGRGLAAAHAVGLVHRDVKPANVIVGEDGRARVLDFGLVREQPGRQDRDASGGHDRDPSAGTTADQPAASWAGSEASSLTATGAHVGTPAYMAPEQQTHGRASAHSDQYSFCVVLHEALFGARPPPPPRRPATLRLPPTRLSRALARGLRDDESQRWPSMNALLRELTGVRWPARRWRLAAALAAMAATLAAATLVARRMVASEARARADAEARAELERALIHDARLVAMAQRLIEREPTAAAIALREVRYPDRASGWRAAASAVLFEPLSRAQLRNPGALCEPSQMSPDGRYVLSPLADGDLVRWRADGGGVVNRIRGQRSVTPLISADARWVLFATAAARWLSRSDGSQAMAIGAPGDAVSFVGASTDVVSISATGRLRRWHDGRAQDRGGLPSQLMTPPPAPSDLTAGTTGVHAFRVRPDGWWFWPLDGSRPAQRYIAREDRFRLTGESPSARWIWVGLEGGDVRLWDTTAAPGTPPRVLRGHSRTVVSASFSPDEAWLATGSYDQTARLWPLTSAAPPVVLRGHRDAVATAHFSPDGRRVVTSSYDRTARVWELDGSGQVQILRGHLHQLSDATFAPDGRHVLTCGNDPAVKLWDVSSPPARVLGHHDAPIWSAALDPSGARLVTAGLDGTARIWSLDGAPRNLVLRGHQGQEVYSAQFSPDGRLVATGASDGSARIWRADSGEPVKLIEGHAGWVYGLAFSPDGQWLATGARDGEVRLTSVADAGPSRTLAPSCPRRFGAWIESLIFDASGAYLLSNGHSCEPTPAVLDPTGARSPHELIGEIRVQNRLALSSRGQIALAEAEGAMSLWNLAGGKLAQLRGHQANVQDLAFSRDGRQLVSSAVDGSARVWNVDGTGDLIILRGHEDWVVGSAFDASGRRVVTASSDGTARVWQLDDPEHPIVLRGHQAGLRFAAFTPRGQVVTAARDGSVRLWDLDAIGADTEGLMRRLRLATSDCLTADQRMQYLDEPAALADTRFAICERAAGR